MKTTHFLSLLLALFCFSQTSAQSYKLTHFMLTATSLPRSYDGPTITISDSFLSNITEIKKGDSSEFTVVKERIIKNKKGRYIKTLIPNGANNYYIEPSEIKAERNAGIYEITVEAGYNNGTTKTLFFKGRKLDN